MSFDYLLLDFKTLQSWSLWKNPVHINPEFCCNQILYPSWHESLLESDFTVTRLLVRVNSSLTFLFLIAPFPLPYRKDISRASREELPRELEVALEVMLKRCDPKTLWEDVVVFGHLEHSFIENGLTLALPTFFFFLFLPSLFPSHPSLALVRSLTSVVCFYFGLSSNPWYFWDTCRAETVVYFPLLPQ